jgi:hypothetical protein
MPMMRRVPLSLVRLLVVMWIHPRLALAYV